MMQAVYVLQQLVCLVCLLNYLHLSIIPTKEHMQTKPGNKKHKLRGQVKIEHFKNCLAATQISHQNAIQTF